MSVIDDTIKGINSVSSALSGQSTQIISGNNFQGEGFVVNGSPSSDGNILPAQNISSQRKNAHEVRKVIHWFVPEYGVVRMYCNPQSIRYAESKLTSNQYTKGGYIVQYWGEKLTT